MLTVAAIVLTLICGVSVCLGWLLPMHRYTLTPELFCLFTAFAAGMMTCLGMAATAEHWSAVNAALFCAGWVAMLGLEHLMHRNEHNLNQPTPCSVSACLGPAMALGMHNLPECFFVLNTSLDSLSLGAGLAFAMILHNIPLGLSLGLAGSRMRASLRAISVLLAGGAPVVMACCLQFFLQSVIPPENIELVAPFAGGALCAIALRQLLPQAHHQGSTGKTVVGFALGMVVLCGILLSLHSHAH